MKGFVLVLLLLAVAGAAKAQQWQELNTGVTEDLYDVCCIDTNTVFACGQNGVIFKTEDGGNSWQEKYSQEDCNWYRIKFIDNSIGFVLGNDNNYNNKLFKTIDGGETWVDLGNPFSTYNSTAPYSCDLFLVDADTLYLACDQLMKSTDGGNSFFQLALEIEWLYETQDLYFEGNVGYIVWGMPCFDTHIAKTTDFGSSWEEILTFDYPEYGIEKAVFHDKDHVFVYGGFVDDENVEYNEIRTEDGFATNQWLLNETLPTGYWGVYPPISGLSFSDAQNGIVIYYWEEFSGTSILTFQTQDGGFSWHELGELYNIHGQSAAVSGHEGLYYLVSGKCVYKMNMTIEGISEEKENAFVFPNPVSNTLFVYGKENSDLILYDYSGRVLLQQKLTDEIQKVEIGGFPSGIYLLGITDSTGRVSFQKILKE